MFNSFSIFAIRTTKCVDIFLHWEMSGQLKNVGFIFIALQPSGRFLELCQVLFSESNSKTHSNDFS